MSWFISVYVYFFVVIVTPGPANIVLLTSTVQYGMRRSLPLLWGTIIGFMLLSFISIMGLEALIHQMPILMVGLTWVGIGYLLFLVWRLLGVMQFSESSKLSHPLSFLQGVLLVFVNVKGWVASLNAAVLFQVPEG